MAAKKIIRSAAVGTRHSARRDAILDVLNAASGALTSDEIHARAVALVPGLGIATVYRNLRLLHEAGLVQPVILPDGQTRYEAGGQQHHHHFHCTACDRIFCLEGCMLAEAEAALPKGFRVSSHEITLYGSCPDCGRSRTRR